MNEKEILRQEYKELLKKISPERRFLAKEDLFQKLKTELDLYEKVLSFVSFKDEIDLSLINEFLIHEKKLHLLKDPHSEVTYDCILVPGLAFDRQGVRLGRGQGYYDKLLAKYKNAHTIGICFIEQISSKELPQESHDIPVKKLCAF